MDLSDYGGSTYANTDANFHTLPAGIRHAHAAPKRNRYPGAGGQSGL